MKGVGLRPPYQQESVAVLQLQLLGSLGVPVCWDARTSQVEYVVTITHLNHMDTLYMVCPLNMNMQAMGAHAF